MNSTFKVTADRVDLLVHRVEQEHRSLRDLARDEAQDTALLERPGEQESVQPFLQKYRSRYTGLMHLVDEQTQAVVNLPGGRTDRELAKEVMAGLDTELVSTRHALVLKRIDLPKSTGPSVPLRLAMVILVTTLALVAESLWTSSAFQLSGESKSRAILIATGVAILMGLFANSAMWLAQYLTKRRWKGLTMVIALVIASVVYYTIGTMRAGFLAAQLGAASAKLNTSPWHFAVLNMAMFLALALLSLRFMPTVEEIATYNRGRKAKRELAALTRAQQRLIEERKRTRRDLDVKLESRARTMVFANALKRRIGEMYLETCQTYIQTNLLRRRTPAPPGMYDDLPDLFTGGPRIDPEP